MTHFCLLFFALFFLSPFFPLASLPTSLSLSLVSPSLFLFLDNAFESISIFSFVKSFYPSYARTREATHNVSDTRNEFQIFLQLLLLLLFNFLAISMHLILISKYTFRVYSRLFEAERISITSSYM